MSLFKPSKLTRLADSEFDSVADEISGRFARAGIRLTLGGEPTYVPFKPEGAEWNVAAVGPTKLDYAYRLADALTKECFPGAITIFSPGKHYPGEVNPRWVVNLLANKSGEPIALPNNRKTKPGRAVLRRLQDGIATACQIAPGNWRRAVDPNDRRRLASVLPMDHNGKRWVSDAWDFPGSSEGIVLSAAEGPVGLRLPLNLLSKSAMRRALTIEVKSAVVHLFLPPLLQAPFRTLLQILIELLGKLGLPFRLEGYLPPDEDSAWMRLGLTADPGVLEVNLPPCETWREYRRWLTVLERVGRRVGLCSTKRTPQGEAGGTGGGNHLLFGGPSLDENPFFTRPAWMASLLRYFQAHPCLAYLFTGMYVGPSSQAPRPDESARDLYDLDLAYRHFESLPAGDHRYVIGETLRHLHIDISGNTHRSEISFDKFWNLSGPAGGMAGLIEFRAIESFPHAEWMSAVALLWQAIALRTFERPAAPTLVRHGERLHDHFFLPSALMADLNEVLADLRANDLDLPSRVFDRIWEWRFPLMLAASFPGGHLEIRRACESWPLLCETPSEGGHTSRFVDTSIERVEITVQGATKLLVNGREIQLPGRDQQRCGLRYRRTALYPSLHPGLKPHLPLEIAVTGKSGKNPAVFALRAKARRFVPVEKSGYPLDQRPAVAARPDSMTYDLRL